MKRYSTDLPKSRYATNLGLGSGKFGCPSQNYATPLSEFLIGFASVEINYVRYYWEQSYFP